MQVSFETQFHKRSLYYWANLHASQLSNGEDYSKLQKSICINIMRTQCFKEIPSPHITFYAYSPEYRLKLCSDLEIHYVQLLLIKDTIDVEIMDRFTDWMTFIKDVHDSTKRPLINQIVSKGSVFRLAYDEYAKINEDELMRERLEARQKFIWDMNTARKNAIDEGRAEGRAEGLSEGKQSVIQEGIYTVALNMLAKSFDFETISELTGLTVNQIKELQ